MRFRLIGPFEIETEDGEVRGAGTPKVSQTLALLLMRANEIVPAETLIRELWQGGAPRSALNTVQTYIHHARKLLTEAGRPADQDRLLTLRSGGYMMRVDSESVDVKVFERLVTQAGADLRARRYESADATLCQALAMWRGPLLVNVPAGDLLASQIARLEEIRVRALELRIEAWGLLGRQRESIAELRVLVHDYPLNESFHGHLIASLYQAGRRAEALQAYRHMHRILRDELGLEPSAEIQRLHQEVLAPPAAYAESAGEPEPRRLALEQAAGGGRASVPSGGPDRRAAGVAAPRRPPQRTASMNSPPSAPPSCRRPRTPGANA
ncbi:BTAD domain-containing putative transcriptional regulator [Streptomyces sp. NPDC053048]|uniref:AfsR/SARP family transcriptional regulator n=1 Tax=Streptomyces sp. NPDC053048 TaxID=3365694 RepID=UPI0037D05F74